MLLPAPIPIGNLAVKHPEVPLLPNYSVNPPSSFWESFLVRPLPPSSVSPVNAQTLLHRLLHAPGLSAAQLVRGRLSVQELTHGASACQLSPPLPPLSARNTPAAVTHGQQVTDNVVGWIKAGFAAGPFKAPPLPDFRCNPILAVPQPGKVRVILNLSAPDGASYNDNVNAREGPDVHCPASGLHYCPVRPWSPHLEIRHARRV